MSTRRAAIERMAEHDPYWRGYLAGLDDRQVAAPDRSAEMVEANRLLQARIDRMLESVEQATIRSAFRVDHDPNDYDNTESFRRIPGTDYETRRTH